jgi:hypothetical protein
MRLVRVLGIVLGAQWFFVLSCTTGVVVGTQLVAKLDERDVTKGETAYSDPSRPLIPTQVGHPFRRNAATDSDRKPATFPSLLGIGGRHPSE